MQTLTCSHYKHTYIVINFNKKKQETTHAFIKMYQNSFNAPAAIQQFVRTIRHAFEMSLCEMTRCEMTRCDVDISEQQHVKVHFTATLPPLPGAVHKLFLDMQF